MDSKRSRDGWHRWSCLAAAVVLQVCSGLGYTFAVYSQHLKETLKYNQEELDSIGAAKDFGLCLGIAGGVLYNFIPPWLSVAVGGLLHFVGYFLVYLASTGILHPPLWMLSSFLAVSVGGDSLIDGAAVMTSVQNFPDYQGTSIGLLKAQVGLSGALFVTLYQAFLKPNVNAYVLLVAIGPAVVSIFLAVFIRPYAFDGERNVRGCDRRFQVAYGMIVVLGLYILISILIETLIAINRGWLVFFAVTMFLQYIILIFVLSIKHGLRMFNLIPQFWAKLNFMDSEGMVLNSQLKSKISYRSLVDVALEDDEELLEANLNGTFEASQDQVTASSSPRAGHDGDDFIFEKRKEEGLKFSKHEDFREVERGNYTLLQNMLSIDFLVISLVAMTGPASGLAIVNNFGQIGRSFQAQNIEVFVGLISVANCFGRLLAGYGSDQAMKRKKYPRPLGFSIAHITMALGCLALSTGYIPLLNVGALLVGSSLGCFWTLVPPVLSEIFGLQNFAALYKVVGACGSVGAYILSAKVLGRNFDEEAKLFNPSQSLDSDGSTCIGQKCFGFSLLVLATVCLLSASLGTILTSRNRRLYERINNF